MKAKLSLIDETSFTEKSFLLSKNLDQLTSSFNVIQNKICIGAFAPIAKEPLWRKGPLEEIDNLTAYPALNAKTKLMSFKKARQSDLIASTDFGFKILGPSAESLEVIPGMILIPGLAFTENGERLGRGKGFYDRYLSGYQGIKIGVCFSEQVLESLPTEKHDVLLDYIVTEQKIINCKNA